MRVGLADAQQLTGERQFAAYSVLDATGTLEIFEALEGRLNAEQRRAYSWSKAQQSPALTMGLRGVLVNEIERAKAAKQVAKDLEECEESIRAITLYKDKNGRGAYNLSAVWDGEDTDSGECPKGGLTPSGKPQHHKWPPKNKRPAEWTERDWTCERCGAPRIRTKAFEPASSMQAMHLFYDILKAPTKFNRTGDGRTLDDEALVQIGHERPLLRPLAELMLRHRDLAKQAGFLAGKLSPKGRYHSSFNVAAAWTSRWSSSKNPYGWGGNLQNVAERHRSIFVADPGFKMFYADLKTAESLHVAYLAGDERYIEAHKGDVHTYVTRELWPDLPWTGDITKDKAIASSTNPEWDKAPGHDLRFQSKRIQHGSNYGLTPRGMSMIAKIPVKHCEFAQGRYFESFPQIRELQRYTKDRVERSLPLYNGLGRYATLIGRPWDKHTYKQGLSFPPQSGVADVLNIGLWRVWNACDPTMIQCLAQVHDAILGQFPEELEHWAVGELHKWMQVETWIADFKGTVRQCVIPVEVAVGANWGKRGKDGSNPDGLAEVKP